MEESAYYLDLALDLKVPVVLTSAMRHAYHVSPDGSATLFASAHLATHPWLVAGSGAYVAFNNELHDARAVRKLHTSAVDTFESSGTSPVATVGPQSVRFHWDPDGESVHLAAGEPSGTVVTVSIDGSEIDRAVETGVVVDGMGLGHATQPMAASIGDATDESVLIVLTSWCPAGPLAVFYETGRILRRNGTILADGLSAYKARVKLLLALEVTAALADLRALFEANRSKDWACWRRPTGTGSADPWGRFRSCRGRYL